MTSRYLPILLLAAASCRFQDLTPGGARRDEATIQAVVASLYQAIGQKDLAALHRVAIPSATALLAAERGAPVLVPMRTMIDIPERRNQLGGARILRSELRVDGEVATDRVMVVARSRDGSREFEATDLFTVARRNGEWHVAHTVLGTWRTRSAP